MNLKVTGVVKYGGVWKRPGDMIPDADEAIAQDLIAKDVAVAIEKTAAEKAAEKAAEDIKKTKKAEKELKELRKKAVDLGIEIASEMDVDALKAVIAAKDQK